MNFIQKAIVRMLGLSKSFTLRDHDFVAKLVGGPTYSGKNVTEATAMQVSTAWACVRIISETIGSLPVAFYERDPTGNAKKIEHELTPLFTFSPNADMTGVEFIEAMALNLALRGNCYAYKETRKNGSVLALYPIAAQRVEPKRDKAGRIYYRVDTDGKREDVPAEKIWHVKGFGSDGLVGLSPIGYARQSLGMALAAEEFQARFFANGANPSWLIKIPEWLTDEQRMAAKKNIEEIWQGLDNAHRAAVLEGGMDAVAATMPLQDAQFLELRQLTVQEICRIYRMPPHMVADLSRSTNNNIEQQGHEFVTYTMMPYLTRIERSAAKALLKPGERQSIFMRYNVDALLRADATGRAALYSSALQNGWMTRNEVRAKENLNSSEDLEGFTVQSNLMPVDAMFDDERRNASSASRQPPGTLPLGQAPEKEEGSKFFVINAGGEKEAAPAPVQPQQVTLAVPPELVEALKARASREEMQRFAELVTLKGQLDALHASALLSGAENAKALREVAEEFGEAIAQQGHMQRESLKGLVATLGTLMGQAREEQSAAAKGIINGINTLIQVGSAERELLCDEEGNPVRTRPALN